MYTVTLGRVISRALLAVVLSIHGLHAQQAATGNIAAINHLQGLTADWARSHLAVVNRLSFADNKLVDTFTNLLSARR